MLRPDGGVLSTYPASKIGTGVSDFVERFWYWKPGAASAAETPAGRGAGIIKALATNQGMMKGKWKVIAVDAGRQRR